MKKLNQLLWLSIATVLFSLSSCTDGFEEESDFDSGVHNKQLSSPTDAVAKKITASDGSDQYEVSWPVIKGAGGYSVNVSIYDDPANPEQYQDTIVDGCSFTFGIKEDTKYRVLIKTLANSHWKKTSNKDAAEASSFVFDTAIPATKIPEGTDIAKFINDFFVSHPDMAVADNEVAFELETGKNYTLDTLVNTTVANVILRGDKVHRSLVTLGSYGGFSIYGGFKIKYLNFDCTEATKNYGILNMGSEALEELHYAYSDGANTNYHDVNTILVQDCIFKSVPNGFIADGGLAWCVKDFRIKDSYIEQNPSDSKLSSTGAPFIDFTHGGISFMNITFTNSTLVNLKKTAAYFMRFSNGSNSSMKKAYGSAYAQGTNDISRNVSRFKMENCTLIRCTAKGQFGNNCWTTGSWTTIDWKKCIFYDCNLLQKLVRSLPCDFNNGNNTAWQVTSTMDETDKNKFVTEDNPVFAGGNPEEDVIAGYDFAQPNGGLNYKPTSGMAAENNFGDSRWLE